MDISKYFLLNEGATIWKLFDKMLKSPPNPNSLHISKTYNIQDGKGSSSEEESY